MSKKIKETLNEKMQVQLPETLKKENILAELNSTEIKTVPMPPKKSMAKKFIPIAASLMLVVGLVGMYFNLGLGEKNQPEEQNDDIVEVMRYQSYDKIYERFDVLKKEADKIQLQSKLEGVFNGVPEDFATDDTMVGSSVPGATGNASSNNSNMLTDSDGTEDVLNEFSSEHKIHGSTNTQEKGVDEGDIIKTDGNYLYIVSGDNKSLSIVDVTGEKMVESAQIDTDQAEYVKELYISGDTLIVVGDYYEETGSQDNSVSAKSKVAYDTFCYAGAVLSDTFVKVYDISDRDNPALKTEYSQQGHYDNSRMIGTKLYAVSKYYVDVYKDDYRDKCIPETEINGVCEKIPADCISVIEESKESTYAVVTTIDVSTDAEPSSEAILGNCEELYASAKGMFLSDTIIDEQAQERTKIYRFEYTDTGVNYMCMGKVPGYINDQFSMSYDGEYFRIATTLNKTEADDDTVSMSIDNRVNNLYILNKNMQIVGKVEDLAKGETIQSVRFVGNMAYVVTFRQTDPLFVIDLSNPQEPTVKGELKIPGFSEYLHPIANGLLVGVGQDGNQFGTNGDSKVSLFDVTDPYEPKETISLSVMGGYGYSSSAVAYNHKLYINLSETEFAVPFYMNKFVTYSHEKMSGNYYIRYKLEDGKLSEVARYYLGEKIDNVLGATYVDNVFYVVTCAYGNGTDVLAFDLATNENIDKLQTAKWSWD